MSLSKKDERVFSDKLQKIMANSTIKKRVTLPEIETVDQLREALNPPEKPVMRQTQYYRDNVDKIDKQRKGNRTRLMEQKCNEMGLSTVLAPHIKFYPDPQKRINQDKVKLHFSNTAELLRFLHKFKREDKTSDQEFIILINKFK